MTPSAAATAPPPSTPPAKSKAAAPPKTSLLYLSESRDETPRYRKAKDAPDWIDTKCKSFLLLGWDTPALKPQAPPPPPTTPLRPAAIVCPGGGYNALAPHEGEPAAAWLETLGIAAFILRYRMPGDADEPRHVWPAARDDLAAALARLRSDEEAARWRIDPNRLVVLGFSAGAHLAAQAIGPPVGPPAAALVLVYPAEEDGGGGYPGLCPGGNDEVRTTLAAEDVAATAGAANRWPAVYVVGSTNDRLLPPPEHADLVVASLKKCGVAVQYQRQKLGDHGFGVIKKWTTPCAAWLKEKVVEKAAAAAAPVEGVEAAMAALSVASS